MSNSDMFKGLFGGALKGGIAGKPGPQVDGSTNSNAIAVNPNDVTDCLRRIATAAENTQNVLSTDLFRWYDRLKTAWYGRNAVAFGQQFQTRFSQIFGDVYHWYGDISGKIQTAARDMAAAAGQDLDIVPISHNLSENQYATETFREADANGTVGIVDLQAFNDFITEAPSLEEKITASFQSMASSVSGTGFMDSTTEGAIRNEADMMKLRAIRIVEDLVASLKQELENTKQTFEDTQSKNTGMFGG